MQFCNFVLSTAHADDLNDLDNEFGQQEALIIFYSSLHMFFIKISVSSG